MNITLRELAYPIDKDDILQIETQSYRNPWDAAKFKAVLRSKYVSGYVAEQAPINSSIDRTLLVGYTIYKMFQTTIHILGMAVLADARHQGVGTLLVDKVKEDLAKFNRVSLIARAGEDNLDAQLFLRSCGFSATKTLSASAKDKDTHEESQVYQMEFASVNA